MNEKGLLAGFFSLAKRSRYQDVLAGMRHQRLLATFVTATGDAYAARSLDNERAFR